MISKNVVIVGGGQAGAQVSWSLRRKGFKGRITILSAEKYPPYQRPPLSKSYLLGGLQTAKLYLKPYQFYQDNSIDLHLGAYVEEIELESGAVKYSSGISTAKRAFYDYLVLATGTSPRLLAADKGTLPKVHYLRSIDDVKYIRESLVTAKKIVVIGGGYIGLEVAAVASQLGLQVTILEQAKRIMERVSSSLISSYYQKVHREQGVCIVNDVTVEAIEKTRTGLCVVTPQGDFEADLVVVGIGVDAEQRLAVNAGLITNNGVEVDRLCSTSDKNIFAAGDCASHPNQFYNKFIRLESVHNAVEQGKTVAASIMGEGIEYNQVPWFWSDQYNLKLQIVGLLDGYDDEIIRGDVSENRFSVFYFKKDLMIASYCINSLKDHLASKKSISSKVKIDKIKLINPNYSFKDCFVK